MIGICYVSTEFKNKKGEVVFRVPRNMLGCMIDIPEEAKEDLMFNMLVQDGSLKIPESISEKKRLENDPMTGITAEGKVKIDNSAEKAGEAKTERKTQRK